MGDAGAITCLGVCYKNGTGVAKDEKKAAELYAKAADMGNADAIVNLGICYEYGTGVTKDEKKAAELFANAADMGAANAVAILGICYEHGTGVTKDEKKAAELYAKAADMGNADAMVKLGICYEYGTGVAKDEKNAAELYAKAADMGNARAILNLGLCYDYGTGVAKDEKKAAELYAKAADMGNARAIVNLGICYEYGTGVAKDEKKAAELYAKAADMGNARAILNLGLCYDYGTGVAKDEKKAAELYSKAADMGNAGAIVNLGVCYEHGTGVAKDEKKAAELYAKAADMGNARAILNLGLCYEYGTGVAKDEKKAAELYAKAADMGNTGAIVNLGVCYEYGTGVAKDEKKAAELYAKAADMGNTGAIVNLGVCYEHGTGVTKDEKKAAELYAKAADMGNANAIAILGLCYEYGTGVAKDEKKAAELYAKAAGIGNANAIVDLGVCYEHGTGVAKDEKKAAELYTKAADRGNTNAMMNLGVCYCDGTGVAKDEKKGAELFAKAADMGNARAIMCLAVCYKYGTGVTKDEAKAAELYIQAANMGDIAAIRNLAEWLGNFTETEQAYRKAVELLMAQIPSQNGDPEYILGTIYQSDRAAVHDEKRAIHYFELSMLHGNQDAIIALAYCYQYGVGVVKNPRKGFSLLKKFSEKGDKLAELVLGVFYEHGFGTAKSFRRAVQIYQKYIGNPIDTLTDGANFLLGCCYYHGIGVVRDEEKALQLFNRSSNTAAKEYTRAITQKVPDANITLSRLYSKNELPLLPKNMRRAYTFCRQAYETSNRTQYGAELADFYLYGNSVRRSLRKAYKLCTADDSFLGRLRLGEFLYCGSACARDGMEAVRLFMDAIQEKESSEALVYLGLCYLNGNGVRQDWEEAKKHFGDAARKQDEFGGHGMMLRALVLLGKNISAKEQEEACAQLQQAAEINRQLVPLQEYCGGSPTPARARRALTILQGQITLPYQRCLFLQRLWIACRLRSPELLCEPPEKVDLNISRLQEDLSQAKILIQAKDDLLFQRDMQVQQLMQEIRRYKNLESSMQKVGDMVQDISKQMDSVVITTEAIHKTTQKIAEELDFLVSFARNDLQDWLHREKADLAPKLLPDDDSNEETINHFVDKLCGYVESHVQTADELVARETEHLQLLFGAHWERFLPETRTALVSGEVLWHRCADITVDTFDFSGVCIAFTTALEAELRRVFFTGFLNYMVEHYGVPEKFSGFQVYQVWPEELLDTKYSDYARQKREGRSPAVHRVYQFSTGKLPYLFGKQKNAGRALLLEKLTEYLRSIVKKNCREKPVETFYIPSDPECFVNRCDVVRRNYRNKAAHVAVMSKEQAEACCASVIGRVDAFRHQATIKGLLMQLYDHLE